MLTQLFRKAHSKKTHFKPIFSLQNLTGTVPTKVPGLPKKRKSTLDWSYPGWCPIDFPPWWRQRFGDWSMRHLEARWLEHWPCKLWNQAEANEKTVFFQSDTHITDRITYTSPTRERTHFGNIGMMCVCSSFFLSQFGAPVLFRGMKRKIWWVLIDYFLES